VLSEESRNYRANVRLLANIARVRPFDGDVAVYVHVYRARQRGDLEDKGDLSPSHAANDALRQQEVEKALETLSDREAEIIRLRFGIGTGYPRTLEELGRIFSVTRERVRQIEAKAIRKLRHPSRSRFLREYVE
jgi:RNA polymerase sigma factor (sigma-70 family)